MITDLLTRCMIYFPYRRIQIACVIPIHITVFVIEIRDVLRLRRPRFLIHRWRGLGPRCLVHRCIVVGHFGFPREDRVLVHARPRGGALVGSIVRGGWTGLGQNGSRVSLGMLGRGAMGPVPARIGMGFILNIPWPHTV